MTSLIPRSNPLMFLSKHKNAYNFFYTFRVEALGLHLSLNHMGARMGQVCIWDRRGLILGPLHVTISVLCGCLNSNVTLNRVYTIG